MVEITGVYRILKESAAHPASIAGFPVLAMRDNCVELN